MTVNNQKIGKENQPAAISSISLSQALLAPLDAIFKAQIHAARSFLNMLLQIGYPHRPVGEDGNPIQGTDDGRPYNQEFYYDAEVNGEKRTCKLSIPALALVPIAPLAVESAIFKLEMQVESVCKHNQIQSSEWKAVAEEQGDFDTYTRPWFIVDPISIKGNLAPSSTNEGKPTDKRASIQIEVTVGKTAMPSGLDKLLTFLTQTSFSEKRNENL